MSGGFWAGSIPPWAWVEIGIGCVLSLVIGLRVGMVRGWDHAMEEVRWQRAQARARRTHPVYRQRPPEVAHEWRSHETLGEEWDRIHPGWRDQTVLEPTAVLGPPVDLSWTGEMHLRFAEFERDMERLIGGTDQQLKEITR